MNTNTKLPFPFITGVQIISFRSFLDSGLIKFAPGINIIIGKNNAGKSALLKCLSMKITNEPHRSEITIPTRDQSNAASSKTKLRIGVDKKVIREFLFREDNTFRVPTPTRKMTTPNSAPALFINWLKEDGIAEFTCIFDSSGIAIVFDAYGLYEQEMAGDSSMYWQCIEQTRGEYIIQNGVSMNAKDTPEYRISENLRKRIYHFDAERPKLSTAPFGTATDLNPDASNLAEVLNNLSGSDPHQYAIYNQLVSRIVPTIKWIGTSPLPNNQLEIRVWMLEHNKRRSDLSVPLHLCGTGVGQILAMLYVIVTADKPKVIVIDEPQTFLHPGAIRELLRIFQEFSAHRYFVATHSQLLISAAHPSTITHVVHDGQQAIISQIDRDDHEALRGLLADLEIRLSDVFGADSILWVEGRTEELCFTAILDSIQSPSHRGTIVLGVKHTGDFESKLSRSVFEIYEQLSKGRGVLPPAVGFIFDREGRSDTQQKDLERQGKGLVVLTPRRMYENYLLIPEAIAAIGSSIEGFRDTPITAHEVQIWIDTNRWSKELFGKDIEEKDKTEKFWIDNVHGTKVLEGIFRSLSQGRVNYDNKPYYALKLTEWIIQHSPESLTELIDKIKLLLQKL